MIAVGLSEEKVYHYFERVAEEIPGSSLSVACINSPNNVTVSGDEKSVDLLENKLTHNGIFARKLKVNIAYHSQFMSPIAKRYLRSITKLVEGTHPPEPITMISTVTGRWIDSHTVRTPHYWVENMLSPVKFSPAMEQLTVKSGSKIWKKLDGSHRSHSKVTFLLEVGFHSALRGPLKEIMKSPKWDTEIPYESLLVRGKSPDESLLGSIGQLFSHGYPVDLSAVNRLNEAHESHKPLCDLPEYPFDHSQRHWKESRVAKRLRLHDQGKLDLLGKPSPDWNDLEAKWRNHLRIPDMPWIEDHQVSTALATATVNY